MLKVGDKKEPIEVGDLSFGDEQTRLNLSSEKEPQNHGPPQVKVLRVSLMLGVRSARSSKFGDDFCTFLVLLGHLALSSVYILGLSYYLEESANKYTYYLNKAN